MPHFWADVNIANRKQEKNKGNLSRKKSPAIGHCGMGSSQRGMEEVAGRLQEFFSPDCWFELWKNPIVSTVSLF